MGVFAGFAAIVSQPLEHPGDLCPWPGTVQFYQQGAPGLRRGLQDSQALGVGAEGGTVGPQRSDLAGGWESDLLKDWAASGGMSMFSGAG